MHRPINTQDAASCGAAYTGILKWSIAPGHRFRPRAGCTCDNPQTCPAPGAHPVPGPLIPSPPEGLAAELNASPGAALIAPTTTFDVIVLPWRQAMVAMISLDSVAPVPCLVEESRAALFVLPSTARYAVPEADQADVELRSGPEGWVALPPSHGVRWDTPPWHEPTHLPVPLLHGRDVRAHLREAVRVPVAQGGAAS